MIHIQLQWIVTCYQGNNTHSTCIYMCSKAGDFTSHLKLCFEAPHYVHMTPLLSVEIGNNNVDIYVTVPRVA